MLRIVSGVLAVLLALFAAVQHNDPDGPFWALCYGAGAAWTGLAALRPSALGSRTARALLVGTIAAAAGLALRLWPEVPGWWRSEVWWESEPAREGMGLMILVLALLVPLATALRARRTGA